MVVLHRKSRAVSSPGTSASGTGPRPVAVKKKRTGPRPVPCLHSSWPRPFTPRRRLAESLDIKRHHESHRNSGHLKGRYSLQNRLRRACNGPVARNTYPASETTPGKRLLGRPLKQAPAPSAITIPCWQGRGTGFRPNSSPAALLSGKSSGIVTRDYTRLSAGGHTGDRSVQTDFAA